MIRHLGFLIRLALIVALAVWLADRPGTAHIVWHDYVIETSAAVLGLAALGVGIVFYLLFRLWHLIKHGPERWKLHRKLQKLRRGHEELSKGLIAIASGDAAEAGKLSLNARKHLGTTIETQMLQAQAAQLAGDYRSAKNIYSSLAANPPSALLGYRGLIMDARREQDWAEVDQLVEKLRNVKPKTPWLNLIDFERFTRRRLWEDATQALDKAVQARLVDPARGRHWRAVLLLATAHSYAKQGQQQSALALAEKAARLEPHWTPALIALTQQQMQSGQHRAAARTIEKHWPKSSHPSLAMLYRDGHDNPLDHYRYMEKLCRNQEDSATNRMALAEAALAADIWGEARRHLMALISHNQATQSTFKLLARLERRETGDEQAAMQWMMKALEAPPDSVWLCRNCGSNQEEWEATCSRCGSFDSLHWQSPGINQDHNFLPLLSPHEIF